jgi:hypothetical protein
MALLDSEQEKQTFEPVAEKKPQNCLTRAAVVMKRRGSDSLAHGCVAVYRRQIAKWQARKLLTGHFVGVGKRTI